MAAAAEAEPKFDVDVMTYTARPLKFPEVWPGVRMSAEPRFEAISKGCRNIWVYILGRARWLIPLQRALYDIDDGKAFGISEAAHDSSLRPESLNHKQIPKALLQSQFQHSLPCPAQN